MKKSILIIHFLLISSALLSQPMLEVKGYDDALNRTRELAGSKNLVRDTKLDQYCYERCVRLAELMLKNPENLDQIYDVEAHVGFGKFEGILENANYLNRGDSINPVLELDKSYNRSKGHYAQRTKKEWNRFGSCTIMMEIVTLNPGYVPGSFSQPKIKRKIYISYEAFMK